METTNILRTFELLMQALAARANTREYCAAKQQMNQAEKYAPEALATVSQLGKASDKQGKRRAEKRESANGTVDVRPGLNNRPHDAERSSKGSFVGAGRWAM